MFKILKRKALKPTVTELVIEAPLIAKKAKPGQFIIVRPFEDSERIPLTISSYDPEEGSVSIIFQVVGGTTMELNSLPEGGYAEVTDPSGNLPQTGTVAEPVNTTLTLGAIALLLSMALAGILAARKEEENN